MSKTETLEEYRRRVCLDCTTYFQCEASNVEDCKRRDDEADAGSEVTK